MRNHLSSKTNSLHLHLHHLLKIKILGTSRMRRKIKRFLNIDELFV
jgi:hypothetical protein